MKTVRVWWIPEFGAEVEIKPITIEEGGSVLMEVGGFLCNLC